MPSGTHFPELLIVGGGITGLSLAWRYQQRYPDCSITLLEKEAAVAQHASGRNSGVLHAGFYYSPDSLKAQLCRRGNQAMQALCREHGLRLNTNGKVVVTRHENELPALHQLYQRGQRNQVPLHLVDAAELQAIEPAARTVEQALYSPSTATVDPQEICAFLQARLLEKGARILLNTRYLGRRGRRIFTNRGVFEPGRVVNCAGLYADRMARDFGFGTRYALLPFKGLYVGQSQPQGVLTRHIYPVPDPRQPFLGVHYTRTVSGQLKIGPTAIPAFWRENYSGLQHFQLRELCEILWYEGWLFAQNRFGFRELAWSEMRKYWRPWLAQQARPLSDSLDPQSFRQALRPGIRAQLLDRQSLELIQDFVVEGDDFSTHVLNAVSPAFTCGLSFADHLLDTALQ
ncbi:MAG: L-2-hydroxyglutarate oxidase [Candidatus Sericytochromatia bacterium]